MNLMLIGKFFMWNLQFINFCKALLCVVIFLVTFSGVVSSAGRPDSFADLAERLKPAVVNVSTTQAVSSPHTGDRPQAPPGSPFEEFFREFFDRQLEDGVPLQRRRKQSLGSGFIIQSSGIVVTNNHVISGADKVSVTLDDNRTFEAEVLGRDSKTDLAVLKIDSKNAQLPYVNWGNSDSSRVGDWVIAIGNPFGLGGSVTAGIISARGRNINAGPYDNFIQTDASINRGNSGGPMFNLEGEVVGINTAIFSPSGGSVGIGFAIPANLAKRVVDQILKYGKTQRGWLGVQIQTVTSEIAESLSLGDPRGALVSMVDPNGPAAKAGLLAGDVILSFANKDVNTMRQLPRIVADTEIGSRVKVVVWRKGRKRNLDVIVGELKESANSVIPSKNEAEQIDDILGMTITNITPALRDQFKIGQKIKGVLVKSISKNSMAAQRGIRPGDVIVEINQNKVFSPELLVRIIKRSKSSGRKAVLLLINRSGELRFVAVPIQF